MDREKIKCARSRDTYWVCETHDLARGMASTHAAAAPRGMPCPSCNVSNPDMDGMPVFNRLRYRRQDGAVFRRGQDGPPAQ
jgi:hypothetical protein